MASDETMKIRKATASDIPAIVALNREVQARHAEAFPEIFRSDPPDQEVAGAFRTMMEGADSCWLVAEADRILAYLSAGFRQREETWCATSSRACYLASIVVEPAFRRKGIAKALFAALKQEALSRGVVQIELDVWAFNGDARETFANLGFRPLMQKMHLVLNQTGD